MPALMKKVGATMDDVENVLNLSTNMIYVAFPKARRPSWCLWQKRLDEMKADDTFRKSIKMASRRDTTRDYSAYDRGIPAGDLHEGW